jgi:hypothetical protein
MRPLLLSLELLRLLEQSMIMMRLLCSHNHDASATEGSPAVFEFSLSNPSAIADVYLYIHWNGWSADYTTTSQTVTVPAGATTGTVSVPTTADTIEKRRTSIASGTASATGTINDNDAAQL